MEEWQSSRSWCKAANCLSAGRIGRNPRSGVKVEVPEKSVPVFRPGKEIGRRLNPATSIANHQKHFFSGKARPI